MIVHRNIVVKGKVQGVFYRASTADVAKQLGLNGFVRNERNGDVYIEAEGEESVVLKLVDWCRSGPPRARVDAVAVTDSEIVHFQQFEIKR